MKKFMLILKQRVYFLSCVQCNSVIKKFMAELSPNEEQEKKRDHRGFCSACRKITKQEEVPPEQS